MLARQRVLSLITAFMLTILNFCECACLQQLNIAVQNSTVKCQTRACVLYQSNDVQTPISISQLNYVHKTTSSVVDQHA